MKNIPNASHATVIARVPKTLRNELKALLAIAGLSFQDVIASHLENVFKNPSLLKKVNHGKKAES